MAGRDFGYHGVILEINLSTGQASRRSLDPEDAARFIGGRGLGMKLLWERLKNPGVDALSGQNPLLFMPGPFSGFPIPSSSRTCVVTKSPHTSPLQPGRPRASSVSYGNMGGFFGPEIRFAGYDGIMVSGRASRPVYICIADDRVEVRDAGKFWGMKTGEFDEKFLMELGDRRFRTCYIGPAGENRVAYAAILNTSARAAGRGGVGCVMGAKNLKAIAVHGTRMPEPADRKVFAALLEEMRQAFRSNPGSERWRRYGTASALNSSSDAGTMAVRNYREGTFPEVGEIGAIAAEQKIWMRDFACFCCPLACKKAGRVEGSPYAGQTHDGPEYETGTMFGANLLVSDLAGLMRTIRDADDLGLDQISCGNVIGFLMEAYEKGLVDKEFLGGIDLRWGNVEAVLQMIRKIALAEGAGRLAGQGVKALAAAIGKDAGRFACHVKGHEMAAWNVHTATGRAIGYATSNRGACHLNGGSVRSQNNGAAMDSLGLCRFAAFGFGKDGIYRLLTAITGREWDEAGFLRAGERIFNLEKSFNWREGFRRADDDLPERFFSEPLTVGPKKGAVLKREEFAKALSAYYKERGWDEKTGKPLPGKLKELGLDFVRF